ncbi:MAG: PIN domain-containing protein [Clostridiales bacterium]|jgi:predicted nucleic acid-binding protein|nr:PIN domain-containing protein [Clostridiales bacterium]
MIFALDTNIVTAILKYNQNAKKNFKKALEDNNSFSIPSIVRYETERGLRYVNAYSKLKEFRELYENSIKSQMDEEVFTLAINLYVVLRKRGDLIDDADLFIASICLTNSFTLVTNNTNHFERIEGLKIVDWLET